MGWRRRGGGGRAGAWGQGGGGGGGVLGAADGVGGCGWVMTGTRLDGGGDVRGSVRIHVSTLERVFALQRPLVKWLIIYIQRGEDAGCEVLP